jgi:hypothetical protein
MKRRDIATLFAAILGTALSLGVTGCQKSTDSPPEESTYKDYLYMTDTTNGHVYSYDSSTHKGSSLSLVTTGTNAAGEIAFFNGIGYVAMGTGGIWYFDPSSTNPAAKMITGSGTLNAQYFAFYGPSKAYVSVVDYSGSTGGIYTFNPSSPGSSVSAVIAGTSGKNFQDIIVGSDDRIYATNNSDGSIIKINPHDDSVSAPISTSAVGTTGIVAGTYKGSPGVFVANNGGYSGSSGSIDFIATGATTATKVIDSSIYPSRVVQLSNGNLMATGYGHTYLVNLSQSTAAVTELKDKANASFGSFDIAYKDDLIYVPVNSWNVSNKLYVFDASGTQQSYSPISVMIAGTDNISNIGFYE